MSDNEKIDFGCTTFVEVKIGGGRLVEFQVRPEDKDKVKDFAKYIKNIELPVTKEIKNIQHGGFGRYTRFDIEQKKYAGGGSGFIEILKINNPPENRNGNIIHEYESGGSKFWEFETIDDAEEGWKHSWGLSYPEDILNKSKGFIRMVKCDWFSPWFYAVANQALYNDFAFPNTVGNDHPIYRPFNKFVIRNYDPLNKKCDEDGYIDEIKTCIAYTCRKVKSHNSYNAYIEHTIYWDDGTLWSGSSLKDAPKLADKSVYKVNVKKTLLDYERRKIKLAT